MNSTSDGDDDQGVNPVSAGRAPATTAPGNWPDVSAPPEVIWTPVSVGTAVLWHWLTAAIPVILLTGLAVAVGLLRTPTYTATSSVTVSQTAGAGGLIGFADASASLAAGYSRAIAAPAVAGPVGRKLGLSTQSVQSRVTASPIPASPILKIEAVADTASESIRLANQASRSLIRYVDRLSNSDSQAKSLLDEFQQASSRLSRLDAHLRSLKNSGAESSEISRATARRDTVQLEAQAAASAYQQNREGQPAASPLQLLSPANQASSDRVSKLELLVLAGLIGGLIVGGALATYRANH